MEKFGTVLDQQTELSDTDFEVLLLHLSRDKGAIAFDGKVVIVYYSPNMTQANYMLDDQVPALERLPKGSFRTRHNHCIHQDSYSNDNETGRKPREEDRGS